MSLVVSDAEVKDGLVIQILRRPTKAGCGKDHGGLIGLEDSRHTSLREVGCMRMRLCLTGCWGELLVPDHLLTLAYSMVFMGSPFHTSDFKQLNQI